MRTPDVFPAKLPLGSLLMRLSRVLFVALQLSSCHSSSGHNDSPVAEVGGRNAASGDDAASGGDAANGGAGATSGADTVVGAGADAGPASGGLGTGDSSAAGAGGTPDTDPCLGVPCDTPPGPHCTGPGELTTYDQVGSCDNGTCRYTTHAVACACVSDTCETDPCVALTCSSPPEAKCKDLGSRVSYAAVGTCDAGSCRYSSTEFACPTNQQCGGKGVCNVCNTDGACGATCTACAAAAPKCKDAGTTSNCVACISDADCGGGTPKCNPETNVCEAAPSCVGLAKTCGPSGNADCCAANLVTGGSFNRANDVRYPATVANFRLDNYEITVGRFRKFVAAYAQTMIAAGAGRNPNNPSDSGWNAAWNANLPVDAAALRAALKYDATYQTWTDGVGTAAQESLPINSINWYVAEAFCIWDAGRLPTEAEWNYAAAGGAAQRPYPWGASAPDCSFANFLGAAGGTDYCVAPPTGAVDRVGSESPKGDGLFGQSDLAGNVWEWVQDWYTGPYVNPCDNCASSGGVGGGIVRGGGFRDGAAGLQSSHASAFGASYRFYDGGARCARTP